MEDPKEPDDASIESNPETIVCSSCEEVVDQTEFYRCSSCDNCDNADSPISDVRYCDVCIGHHIKKKHDVLDSKGYRPAICEEHKTLCSSFCETCRSVFCSKCIKLHSEHKFTAVSEKASEMRKEVFKYLEQFDKLSKPLAERKNAVDGALQHRRDAFPDCAIEKFSENFCRRFKQIILKISPEWETLPAHSDSIHAISDRVDSNITTLRSMLTMSDGVFVSQFVESKSCLDSSIREQEREIDYHGNATWCRTLDSIINDCINDAVATWNSPPYEKRLLRKLQFKRTAFVHLPSQWENFVYDLTSTETEISFSYFSKSEGASMLKRWRCHHSGSQRFLCKSRHLVALIDDEDLCVSLYDLKATQMPKKSLQFSKNLKILGMFTAFYSEHTFFCWNETSSSLILETEQSGNRWADWMMPCDSQPKLFKFMDDVLLFVQDDNKVTIYDSKTQLNVQVLQRHHGMSQIDDVVLSSHTSALFLDCGKRTVLVCGFTLSHSSTLNWQIQEIYRWDIVDNSWPAQLYGWNNVGNFDCTTWDDGKLVACISAKMFTANLSIN